MTGDSQHLSNNAFIVHEAQLTGLPYSVPENLCDLYIPPPNEESSLVDFHYRQLSSLTGPVIVCLQSEKSPTLSTAAEVNEQIDEVTAQLPVGYLDLEQIRLCRDAKERHTRAFRLVHVHSLKAQLYMPLFLQGSHDDKQGYSRMACSAPSALTAAVILFVNLLGYGRNAAADAVQERAADKIHDKLVESSLELRKGERREIVVPYFGRVTGDRREGASQAADPWLETSGVAAPLLESNVHSVANWSALHDDICLSYSSPWTVQENHAERLVDNADAAAAFDCTTGPDYGFSQY
ncbi:hypothetical protein BDQ94DRAFT_170410 [Aspergillus welwitschiae]|uniref:Uncharacterized protein n=1 Tax=Aspergillus welwitschiae TaxID=1341132 RepID=A0A3F3Q1Z4_9EURO|nr:hypothetical protein BDQ94DRAFT_170410 [Aspergillus welwitschiae]RDH33249.1 hypothetical protein BDQ94DRAFT_170410 [Aspergillus welwitschiae]